MSVELSNQQTIANEEKNKAVAQALIAEYEKYSTKDKADAEKAAQEANAKLTALDQIKGEKYTADQNARQAYREAYNNLNGSLYVQTLQQAGPSYYDTEDIRGEVVNYTMMTLLMEQYGLNLILNILLIWIVSMRQLLIKQDI